jgi:hypothetical protein
LFLTFNLISRLIFLALILTVNCPVKYIAAVMETKLTKSTNEHTNSPKAAVIAVQKQRFVAALRSGGNVSKALNISGLARKTAYVHFANDKAFAEAWQDVVEESIDELYDEARHRAVEGVEIMSGKTGEVSIKKSDALLIYLLKQKAAQRRWRTKLIETGKIAIEIVRIAGEKNRLSEETIANIQNEMIEAFNQISVC